MNFKNLAVPIKCDKYVQMPFVFTSINNFCSFSVRKNSFRITFSHILVYIILDNIMEKNYKAQSTGQRQFLCNIIFVFFFSTNLIL